MERDSHDFQPDRKASETDHFELSFTSKRGVTWLVWGGFQRHRSFPSAGFLVTHIQSSFVAQIIGTGFDTVGVDRYQSGSTHNHNRDA